MIDVERLRQVASKRQRQGLVGMILSVDQVLALIARGDAQQAAYQMRVEDLEATVARLRKERMAPESTEAESSDDLVPVREAAERAGIGASTVAQMARRGAVYGERRRVQAADGSVRQIWCVDPDEVEMYARLSLVEKRSLTQSRSLAVGGPAVSDAGSPLRSEEAG